MKQHTPQPPFMTVSDRDPLTHTQQLNPKGWVSGGPPAVGEWGGGWWDNTGSSKAHGDGGDNNVSLGSSFDMGSRQNSVLKSARGYSDVNDSGRGLYVDVGSSVRGDDENARGSVAAAANSTVSVCVCVYICVCVCVRECVLVC
jgi:hypothetical protein